MNTVNVIYGILYLLIGLGLTVTITSRLYVYWEGFERAQKTLLISIIAIMFAYTLRGIELLWFSAPAPRPFAFLAIIGGLGCLVALLMPVDKRLEPESWKDQLRKQEPENYDKYIKLLDDSARNRMIKTGHSDKYLTEYGEDS